MRVTSGGAPGYTSWARIASQVDHASNIWEAAWCGDKAIAAVISNSPSEGFGIPQRSTSSTSPPARAAKVYKSQDQMGWPAASPSGRHLAVVDAICSDRWIVAGDVRLVDTSTGKFEPLDIHSVDVTHAEWRSEQHLLLAGHRDFEIVVGVYDVTSKASKKPGAAGTSASAGGTRSSRIGQNGDAHWWARASCARRKLA